MAYVTTEVVNFDDLIFPETVYKYREMCKLFHHSILTDQVVFLSPPEAFPDKFDCRIPIRYDLLTDEDILEIKFKSLKEQFPEWDDILRRQEAIRWSNLGLLKNPVYIQELETKFWKEFNDRYGVLCLTANPINPRMWNEYSDGFNGFCVGFNPRIMFAFIGGGGKVDYPPELPIIMPFDDINYIMATQPFTKLPEYAFEEEYRTTKMWESFADHNDRKIKIPIEAFTELIIGYKVNKKNQIALHAQAKTINPKMKVMLATLKKDKVILKSLA